MDHLESSISPRRADLLARLAAERSFLLQQLEGLDEATLTHDPVFGGWTAAGLLAHLAYWDALTADWLSKLADGRPGDIRAAGNVDGALDTLVADRQRRFAGLPFAQGVSLCHHDRRVLLRPCLIPHVVVGLLWLWRLDPQLGLINQILGVFGISRPPFFGSVEQAMPSIAGVNIWRHVGYTAILIFAGLQTIPKDVYEAGAIDGATETHMFWAITIPLLRPILVFVAVTTITGSFQIFDTIAITTKGGPVGATRVIYWYIYEYAFNRFQMGYATAAAVVLFLVLITITLVQLRFFRADSSDLA